jgi:S1-C subfamily serine protease
VRVNGRLVTTFEPLAEVLDAAVGQAIDVQVERGGERLERRLEVQDLHAITPAEYLEFGDAVVHALSYQMARHLNAPISGVFVANPGYTLGAADVPRGAVIEAIAGRSVATLAEFESVVAGLPDGGRATLRYRTLDDPRGVQTRVMRMDRRWFPARHCRRDDSTGYWPCRDLPPPPAATPEPPAATTFVATGDPLADRLAPSLVLVTFDMPFSVAGVTERNYRGTGLIVDAARGLVAVDRNTVPVAVGDVRITVAGSVEVPGRVEFVHPLHNLALVSFDPQLLEGTPLRAASLDPRGLVPGEAVTVIGLGGDSRVRSIATTVASVEDVSFPLSRTLQFRESNLEVVKLVNAPAEFDGVVVGRDGRVRALWSSFATESGRELAQLNRGLPVDLVEELLEVARMGRALYSLEVEFETVSIAAARKRGLSAAWVQKLEALNGAHRQVLGITRIVAGSPAAGALREGDLLLAIDGNAVNRFRAVERATQAPRVKVTVLRDGEELTIETATAALGGGDIDRLLLWAGAVLHAPHRAMAAQRGIPPEGVFVAYFAYGSPATRHKLFAGRRIVEVDGQPTPDLDTFVAAVRGRPDRSSLRLRTITWNGSTEVITAKLDRHYWPAYELTRSPSGWERHPID